MGPEKPTPGHRMAGRLRGPDDTGNFSRAAEARTIAQPAFQRPHPVAGGMGRRRPGRPGAHPAELTAAGNGSMPCSREVLCEPGGRAYQGARRA